MPAAVVYLCIALFTELFNLAGGDIPVLITVSTLVERQASADSTFPRSWIIKTHDFNLSHTPHRGVLLKKKKKKKVKSRFEGEKRTKKASFILAEQQWQLSGISLPKRHTAHNHQWSARTCHTLHTRKKKILSATHCLQEGLWCLTLVRGRFCWTFWSPCQSGASGW